MSQDAPSPDDALGRRLDELEKLVAELTQRLRQAEQDNQRLRDENRRLREQLEAAQRAAARQAAPFRREERLKKAEADRKRPGRAAGHLGACRPTPQPDRTEEVPLPACPKCGGPLQDVQRREQFIEEIPPVRPQVVRVITYEGRCPCCGDVESIHPWQTSRAVGAAKVQLGPRALATLAWLNKLLGLTMRKTCRLVQTLLGLRVTPGGLSQALDRMADRLAGDYQGLQDQLRAAPAVFADETSWWVGGPGWWLWTYTTPDTTLYRVDQTRGAAVVQEVLGTRFAGTLVSDCLSTYDPIDCRKHKCLAHHGRAIAKARESPGQKDPRYLREWKNLFTAVRVLHAAAVCGDISPEYLAERRAYLDAWVDRLLAHPCTQPGDAAVQNRLRKQRMHLLGCLSELAAEPTNNRAERSLRPAVIARKLSCGNKTDRGRRTWQILTSLAETCRQRTQDFAHFVTPRLILMSSPG